MIAAQDTKFVQLANPASIATNGTASGTVSCVGYNYATIVLSLGTAAASNVDALLQVSESDGTTYTTSADFTITTAAPNTSTGQIYAWYIKPRKKNLKIVYNPNTNVARLASCVCLLSRAAQSPDTNTLRGLDGSVFAQ